jgi:DNA-binding response OmpR family regulator
MKIFVVDDDPVARMIAVDHLDVLQWEVREFPDGASLLAAIDDEPDLILLDIEMPGMDGIAVCRAFRQAGGRHSQIIFVSSHDDLESRLAAYQAGGSDFVVKPFDGKELVEKLRAAAGLLTTRNELLAQSRSASHTAFAAMSSMGELGVLLEFLRTSFTVRNTGQLAEALFEALKQYGLHGVLEMRMASGRKCFSSRGQFTPLEDSILGHARGMGRIFHFRDRLIINGSTVALLALNLPMNDPDRIGRLRDHLAILVDGAEARIGAMESEVQLSMQAKGVMEAVAEITRTLMEIERNQAGSRILAMSHNAEYIQSLAKTCMRLGMSDVQETALTLLAEEAYTRLGRVMDDGQFMGDHLHAATERLSNLAAC